MTLQHVLQFSEVYELFLVKITSFRKGGVEGRGSVPGNNDSGGLCSCYLWNALGVFPVSGQDLMIIGSPRVREAVLHLGNGKQFRIQKQGGGIYVKSAALNGKPLQTLCFSAREMMRGGELVLVMTEDALKAQLT